MRHFQRKQRKCLATWWPSTFLAPKYHFPHFGKGLLCRDTFRGSGESVSSKLSIWQNAESGISGPRKFLATFKMSRQNKPIVLSFSVCHLERWRSCTFCYISEFVAVTGNPSLSDKKFKGFMFPVLLDFVGGNESEMLLVWYLLSGITSLECILLDQLVGISSCILAESRSSVRNQLAQRSDQPSVQICDTCRLHVCKVESS